MSRTTAESALRIHLLRCNSSNVVVRMQAQALVARLQALINKAA